MGDMGCRGRESHFTDSALEEIGAIKPVELIDAYYTTKGHVMTGTEVMHQY